MLFLILASLVAVLGGTSVNAESYRLHIYLGPSRVLADNTVTGFFVQIQDSRGAPVRPASDVTVYLSSSLTDIGTVDLSMTIAKGSVGGWANFVSTYTPGSTTITASATGYLSDEAVMMTIGPKPYAIAVFGLPPFLPADGNSYSAVVVQVQNVYGYSARAPLGGLQVTLFSSNTTVGTVSQTAFIPSGANYTVANFVTTEATGATTITAVASGLISGQATITTQRPTFLPSRLQVYLGPTRVAADGGTNQKAAVQFVDSNGTIAQPSFDQTISLTSSATDVAAIGSTVTIATGSTFSLAPVTSTFKEGSAAITAAATNYVSGFASLTTVGSAPSKLAVFCLPSALPADQVYSGVVVVQLQDALGYPAKSPTGSVLVNLYSSDLSVGSVVPTVTVPSGQTQVTGTIRPTLVAGSTTVIAQRTGYESGQTLVATYAIDAVPLRMSATLNPTTIINGKSLNITAFVTLPDNTPVLGANLQLTSAISGTFLQPSDQGNGYYTSVFTPPIVSATTNFTIVVTASKTGYASASQTLPATITVLPLKLSVTPNPATMINGKTLSVTAYVALTDNTPMSGANLQFASTIGGTFQQPTDEGNGYYTSVFTPPSVSSTTNFTIAVTASKTGYTSASQTLQATITVLPLRVSITPNPAIIINGKTLSIIAYVTLPDNTPVTEANLQFASTAGGTFLQPSDQGNGYYTSVFTPPIVSATTNFTITFTASKTGYISASLTLPATINLFQVLVTATPNPAREGETANITAYAAYPGGTPVLDATVEFSSNGGGTFSAVTDGGNGYYWAVFTPPTVPSYGAVNCTIISNVVIPAEREDGSVVLTVLSSQEVQIGSIQLHVQDESGVAIAQASVTSISQPAGVITLYASTDQAGDVSFAYARSGSYTFQVTKSGYANETFTIAVAANETATRSVTLAPESQSFSTETILISAAIIAAIVVVPVVAIAAFRKRAKEDEGRMRKIGAQ
jgi:adhesin/invasin